MRNVILIIAILFCATTFSVAQTQEQLYPIEDFVGTWQYVNNDTVFTVKFVKGTSINNHVQTRMLRLHGGYALEVNGTLLDSYLDVDSIRDMQVNPSERKIYVIASTLKSYTRSLGMTFYDQRKKHFNGKGIGGGSIVMIAPNKLYWKLDEALGISLTEGCEDCPEVKPIGFSVPTNVILTKVE